MIVTSGGASAILRAFCELSAALSHAGKSAKLNRFHLGRRFQIRVKVLVTFKRPGREWEWIMRPKVAKTLEALGWCDDSALQELKRYEDTYTDLEETTRRSVVDSRLGQGQFRAQVIDYWGGCAVTGCQAIELLNASHIKPWRESTNAERLDPYNGLLVTPNIDAAFDRGLISFQDDGRILISPDSDKKSLTLLGIHKDMKIQRLAPQHIRYLRFHRNKVFKKQSR